MIVPTAGIAYDKTTLTRENVIARLINPSTPITITNNNGSDTYVFLTILPDAFKVMVYKITLLSSVL